MDVRNFGIFFVDERNSGLRAEEVEFAGEVEFERVSRHLYFKLHVAYAGSEW